MTCCVIALALAWQVIHAWQRLRGWCGLAPRRASLAATRLRAWLTRPALRIALLAVIAFEAGAAGTYVYQHRSHIGHELGTAVFGVTGYARDLCRWRATSPGDG